MTCDKVATVPTVPCCPHCDCSSPQVKNKDQYGRNVAACSISPDLPFQQPEDMGTFLVSNGYAVAYR